MITIPAALMSLALFQFPFSIVNCQSFGGSMPIKSEMLSHLGLLHSEGQNTRWSIDPAYLNWSHLEQTLDIGGPKQCIKSSSFSSLWRGRRRHGRHWRWDDQMRHKMCFKKSPSPPLWTRSEFYLHLDTQYSAGCGERRVQFEDNQVRQTFCQRETWQVTLQTQLIVSTLIYFYQIWTLTTYRFLALPSIT